MEVQRINEETADSPRSEHDRRTDDAQLLRVKKERRLVVERRLQKVDETTVSFSDWVRSMVFFLAKIRRQAKAKSSAKRAKPKQW